MVLKSESGNSYFSKSKMRYCLQKLRTSECYAAMVKIMGRILEQMTIEHLGSQDEFYTNKFLLIPLLDISHRYVVDIMCILIWARHFFFLINQFFLFKNILKRLFFIIQVTHESSSNQIGRLPWSSFHFTPFPHGNS